MSGKKAKVFSEKHSPDFCPDPNIEKRLRKSSAEKEIACVQAFVLAKDLSVAPEEIGRTADVMNIAFTKCQLGLFGYKPEKKIVKAEDTSNQVLKNAIIGSSQNNRLSCQNAWQIAERFKVNKLTVSNVSQANKIKISNCQLGAF